MKFFDFFAGIGGFRLGMEMAGHECVGHCEIDKYADMSYRAIDTGCEIGQLVSEMRIRKLTPKECFRLQGFPDEYFERAAKVCSDSQLPEPYKAESEEV